jgi:hypothetical protein
MTLSSRLPSSRPSGQRKPYATPQLTCYGHVKDIVQGEGGMMNDAGADMSRPCWIAEALYGLDDARTLILRSWMWKAYVDRRPWWFLVGIYIKCGHTIASLIRRRRLQRRLFLPLFDFLARKAFDASAHRLRARRHPVSCS